MNTQKYLIENGKWRKKQHLSTLVLFEILNLSNMEYKETFMWPWWRHYNAILRVSAPPEAHTSDAKRFDILAPWCPGP